MKRRCRTTCSGIPASRILADLVTHTLNAHASLFDFSRTGVIVQRPGAIAAIPSFFKGFFGGAKPRPVTRARAFVPVMKIAALTESKPQLATANGREIALFKINGNIHALDNACSHAGGPLCQGTVAGPVVTCPWHGSKFDVTTGTVVGGPASRNQRRYAV